jgi:hypothetical protein
MPVSFEFLRGVLGVLCILFAYMAGKTAARVHQGTVKISRLYGWVLRAAACGGVLALRHSVDSVAFAVWILAAAAAGAGWWFASRPSVPPEDLTSQIFPE